MKKNNRVSVDILGMPLDKTVKSRETLRIWLGILLGALLSCVLTAALDMQIPVWLRPAVMTMVTTGYVISWARHAFQKMNITIIEHEPPDTFVFGVCPDTNLLTLGVGNGEGETCDIPLFRNYVCTREESVDSVFYSFSGKPSKAFASVCSMVINADGEKGCVCQKVRRINVSYLIQKEELPSFREALDKIAEKSNGKNVRVLEKEDT